MNRLFGAMILFTGLIFQSCSKKTNADPVVEPGSGPVETQTLKLIPDSAFRVYLKANVCPNAFDKSGKLIDITHSEVVNFSGTMTIDSVTCPKPYVVSLKGIGYFPKMRKLIVKDSPVDSIDLKDVMSIDTVRIVNDKDLQYVNVSGCTNMRYIRAANVPVVSLDLSNLPALNYVNLVTLSRLSVLKTDNDANLQHLLTFALSSLKTVNVSTNPALRRLFLDECNSINAIDVTHNSKLFQLVANYCPSLKSIDLSKCDSLGAVSFDGTAIDSIDFSHNPNLFSIAMVGTPLRNLSLISNPKLCILYLDGCGLLKSVDLRAQTSFNFYAFDVNKYIGLSDDDVYQVLQRGLASPVPAPDFPVETKATRVGINGATQNLFGGLRLPIFQDAGFLSLAQVKVNDAVKDNYSLVMSRRVLGTAPMALITVYAADRSTILCNDYDPQLFRCN
jgi:hypothetical protein